MDVDDDVFILSETSGYAKAPSRKRSLQGTKSDDLEILEEVVHEVTPGRRTNHVRSCKLAYREQKLKLIREKEIKIEKLETSPHVHRVARKTEMVNRFEYANVIHQDVKSEDNKKHLFHCESSPHAGENYANSWDRNRSVAENDLLEIDKYLSEKILATPGIKKTSFTAMKPTVVLQDIV
ncbi:hypothetical protein SK128_009500, partial [Halocaridina rubra]